MQVSHMAENLIGSEIIKLAGEINQLIAEGKDINNFTIGDFDPKLFPIPQELTQAIINAYLQGETNYPAANGVAPLRKALAAYIANKQGLNYTADEFLVAGGARPLIYAIYKTLLDPGDEVIFPVPSWNNNHYCHLMNAKGIVVQTAPENKFMPTLADLQPHFSTAVLLALCSPLNPTGTVFSKENLYAICEAVLIENQLRLAQNRKPLYIMFDQIYWALTFGNTKHHDPVSLIPQLRPFVIYVDGLSKAFAATGVRVGWSFGPPNIINKMKSILSHIGAWAPKAEQVAVANYLHQHTAVDAYIEQIKASVADRLFGFYQGFEQLRQEGLPVCAIAPEGAIYLTVQFDLVGKITPHNETLDNMKAVAAYLLHQAQLAIVPFSAFGDSPNSTWFRLSVGTCGVHEVSQVMQRVKAALENLRN